MEKLIRDYCRFTNLSIETENEFIKAYNLIFNSAEISNKVNNLLQDYANDITKCLEVVKQIKKETAPLGVHEYTVNALSYILMIPTLKKEYEKRNLPDWIFNCSIKDMSYHIPYSIKMKGIHGTFTDWHENIFTLKCFGLGRLQIIFRPSYADFSGDDISIKKGEPMLDVHIPNTGTPLTYEECEYSYKVAVEMFKDKFNGKPIIFHCSTWLLWERHKELLKPTSNIVKFLERYTLVEKGLFKDHEPLYRIFEVDCTGDIKNLPTNTSLQKTYYNLINSGEMAGWGTGLFIYE